MVSKLHYTFFFAFFPLIERLVRSLDVKGGVISLIYQLLRISALIGDAGIVIGQQSFFSLPLRHIGLPYRKIRHRNSPHNYIAHIPRLSIKHVESVPLILHTQIK